MLDNDNLTYSYQRRSVGNHADRALITLERSQKLDLLLHLLANLQQSLIVCGPEGIGKTTLLEAVRQNRKDLWEIALLAASPGSSFESLINDLLRCLNIPKASAFDLSALREFCAAQKVVLLIDDAGHLVPGLITMLMEFADSLPGLRLVFAMSHDQFHIKSGTDQAVEECHLIELPPLNKKQCGEYLQNLSAQPGAVISFNAINDNLIDDLYRDTHGIPGKILAELPKLADYQSRKSGRIGLWLTIAVVLAGSGYAVKSFLPTELARQPEAIDSRTDNVRDVASQSPPPAPIVPEQTPPPASSATATPAQAPVPAVEPIQMPATTTPPITPATSAQPTPEAVIPQAPAQPTNSSPANTTPISTELAAAKSEEMPAAETKATVTAPPIQIAEKPAERKPGKPATNGSERDWIMAQPPGNYTLQVMVLSNKEAAMRFQKKYADYSDGLKYYPIAKGDQEKYVIIYGSFQTAAEAAQLKAVMPSEFKQALEKRFSAVQKESRR